MQIIPALLNPSFPQSCARPFITARVLVGIAALNHWMMEQEMDQSAVLAAHRLDSREQY
jgi:hypothetical protein